MADKTELVIFAAASTRDALQKVELIYEAALHVDLIFNFGSSGDLSDRFDVAVGAEHVVRITTA